MVKERLKTYKVIPTFKSRKKTLTVKAKSYDHALASLFQPLRVLLPISGLCVGSNFSSNGLRCLSVIVYHTLSLLIVLLC